MKKFFIVIAIIAILSGCGTNDMLVCTTDNTAFGMTSSTKYVIDYKDNDIKKITLTYDYKSSNTDGVNTGTDGTTNDDNTNTDGVISGVIGKGLDDVVDEVVDGIIDLADIRTRHNSRFGTYRDIDGFTSEVNVNDDNAYKVTYTYDLSRLTDNNISTFGISSDLNTFRNSLTSRGMTCK